jgi:hypothetical protein
VFRAVLELYHLSLVIRAFHVCRGATAQTGHGACRAKAAWYRRRINRRANPAPLAAQISTAVCNAEIVLRDCLPLVEVACAHHVAQVNNQTPMPMRASSVQLEGPELTEPALRVSMVAHQALTWVALGAVGAPT